MEEEEETMICTWYVDVETTEGKHLGNVRCRSYTETGSILEHNNHGPIITDREGLAELRRDGR